MSPSHGSQSAPIDVVQLHERILALDLVGRDHLELDALRARHRRDVAVFVHPLLVVGEADRAGDVIVDRIADLVARAARRAWSEWRCSLMMFHEVEKFGTLPAACQVEPEVSSFISSSRQSVQPILRQMVERAAPDSPAPIMTTRA